MPEKDSWHYKGLFYVLTPNIVVTIIAFALAGCIQDITLDIDPGESQIVVNGIFENGQAPVVKLFRTTAINSSDLQDSITGAHIELIQEGQIVDELEETVPGIYESDYQDYQPGDSLSIRIDIDGISTISALTNIPHHLVNVQMSLDTIPLFDYDGSANYILNITFEDNEKEANFYDLEVWLKYEDEWRATYLDSDDPVITRQSYYSPFPFINNSLTKMPFSDQPFNGQQKTIQFKITPGVIVMSVDTYLLPEVDMMVLFKSTTKEQYLYTGSILNHLQGRESDLIFGSGQPVDLLGNVQGGYGIFACEEVFEQVFHINSIDIGR